MTLTRTLFSLTFVTASAFFSACSTDTLDPTPPILPTNDVAQYVVMSGSGENNGAYLQLTADPTTGKLDPTNPAGRIFFSGNNPDFVNYQNKLLIGMNYPSKGGSSSDYITMAWKLQDGQLVQHGNGVALDGDVKSRSIFKHYLIGMSDQTSGGHYERVKYIDLETFDAAVVDGVLRADNLQHEPTSLMEGETWGVGDIGAYGDYVLLAYYTKELKPKANSTGKGSYATKLANNVYLGVYKFDPQDPQKEYLKYQSTLVRKSADNPGKEAGQIRGNSRSRTETGIEVVGDVIYLFCQGAKNDGEIAPTVPSALLRISGKNIKEGKPIAFDQDYYVDLTDVSGGHFLWRSYYIGGDKFCLQSFTLPGKEGYQEGSHKTFGIFDVKTRQYTPVTGLPQAALIKDIALAYGANPKLRTITFEIETLDSRLPALYTISQDGTATRGTEVDTESIKGVSFLEQH